MLDKMYFAGYADDDAPYTKSESINQLVRDIEEIYTAFLNWFIDNKIKINYNKCCLLLHGNEDRSVNIESYLIRNSYN